MVEARCYSEKTKTNAGILRYAQNDKQFFSILLMPFAPGQNAARPSALLLRWALPVR
jgi:hypothetical protein